jgi:hypothetical protein
MPQLVLIITLCINGINAAGATTWACNATTQLSSPTSWHAIGTWYDGIATGIPSTGDTVIITDGCFLYLDRVNAYHSHFLSFPFEIYHAVLSCPWLI